MWAAPVARGGGASLGDREASPRIPATKGRGRKRKTNNQVGREISFVGSEEKKTVQIERGKKKRQKQETFLKASELLSEAVAKARDLSQIFFCPKDGCQCRFVRESYFNKHVKDIPFKCYGGTSFVNPTKVKILRTAKKDSQHI